MSDPVTRRAFLHALKVWRANPGNAALKDGVYARRAEWWAASGAKTRIERMNAELAARKMEGVHDE